MLIKVKSKAGTDMLLTKFITVLKETEDEVTVVTWDGKCVLSRSEYDMIRGI
jgi:hypothetical protein